jgi:gliding motility-associated-like protein
LKNFLYLFFILLSNSILTFSQPPCATNPVANDFCQSATPICNLNGYCGNTSSTYTYWVSPTNHANETNTPLGTVFCATIQNNSWLKFIADSTVAVFNVWVSNCANNHGIQMQIYKTSDCYNFIPVSNCWNPGIPTNGQIVATGLIPGNVYYFMIDGTNGDVCNYVIAANVGVGSTQTVTPNQRICKGDSAIIKANGGATYIWSSTPADPSLTSQTTLSTVRLKPLQTTTYRVIVTKSGSNAFCPNNIDTLFSTVYVKPLPVLSISATKDHCGVGDGTSTVFATAGSGVYSYLWNTSPVQTTATANNLFQGNYLVTVTDSNGCKAKDSIAVLKDTVLYPQISGQPFLCFGTTATLNAGNNYSTYLWSTGSASQTISISSGGTYIVNVTKNNCSGADTLVVTPITVATPLITGPPYVCWGDTVQLNAGSGYHSYHWSTNINTQIINLTSGGNYTVTVSDTNGCTANSSYVLVQKYGPALQISSSNEICNRNDGSAVITASGGQGSYSYLWSNGGITPTINNLHHGTYTVVVKDSLCDSKASVIVYNTPGPKANFSVTPDFQIFIDQPVEFYFHDLSTGNIISWVWNFGDSGPFSLTPDITHSYNALGNYWVTLLVTDNNACIDSVHKIIVVRDLFTFYIPNAFSPNGDGINDLFTPKGSNVDAKHFEMYIYNRWGNLIYTTKNWNGESTDGWNGTINNSGSITEVMEGVYVYKIIVKELNGPSHLYSGKITLIH